MRMSPTGMARLRPSHEKTKKEKLAGKMNKSSVLPLSERPIL